MAEKLETKLPPQNIEAEASVLGALLLDQEAIIKVIDILKPDDFYKEAHKIIYISMFELFEERNPCDVVTLTNKLDGKNELDRIGGASYLTKLVNNVPTTANVVHYAQIIQHKSTLRKLISAASKISALGFNEESDVESILDEAEQSIFKVSQKYLRDNFVPIKEILTDSFERIDKLHKDKGGLRGIPTGFPDMDNILAGLQPSDLLILAGRPSMGKTSLALNIAQHVATQEGIPVGVFSLEMSKEQLIDRLICAEANVDSWKLRTGNLSDDDFPKIGHAMGVLSEAPLFIDDSPSANAMEMRAKARRLQSEHDLGLIVVDYLQLMESRYKREGNRVQEISEISRSLKGLARELNIPVICCSQLSRAVEQRPDRIPQLADLRDSGSIEQDADVVMFIYREDYYKQDTDKKNIAEIIIRKHRNGPTGNINLYFNPEQMRFTNLEKKREEEISIPE
jgi:replicative DNA helicase